MDYQTYRPMKVPSKTRRTFTRNTFAEHNYNYAHSSKTNYPPRKTTNSVNFRTNSHPPQDRSENYPFFQQNKKKQAPHHTDYLSSDDDYLQPDIFAPYTHEYRGQNLLHIIEFFLQIQQIHEINNQYKCKIDLIHNLFNQFNHKTQ